METAREAPKSDPLDRAVKWIDRHSTLSFIILSGFYWVQVSRYALRRVLWADEFDTLFEARLSTFQDLWNLLRAGADGQPPILPWSTHLLTRHFGESPFVLRLPGMIAFWIMIAVVYWIVARRSSALWGVFAGLFAMSTDTFWYAAEARAYGLLLGCSAIALFCWLRAARVDRPRLMPLALAVSIFLAAAVHYYGALVPVALAAAEAVRDYRRRRVDWPIWFAFGAAILPVLWYLPLIRGTQVISAHFWSRPVPSQLTRTFAFIMGSEFGAFVAVGLIAAFCLVRKNVESEAEAIHDDTEIHEWVAFWSFIALPLAGWLLAVLVTHGYVERYVLQPLIGLSIALSLGLSRALRSRKLALAGAVVVLGFSVRWSVVQLRHETGVREDLREIEALVEQSAPPALPVALSTDHIWLRLSYYRSPRRSHDFIYLVDPDLSLRYAGYNTSELIYAASGGFFPPNYAFRDFLSRKQPFLVFAAPLPKTWLVSALLAEHWKLRLLGEARAGDLYLAGPP